MTQAAAFWDRIAPKYARDPIADLPAYNATLARTLSHLGTSDRVLELGCGTASTAMEIAPHVAHVTATDISPAMVEIGREKVWDAGLPNVTLRATASDDPALAADGPFDAVLAFNLLHLVEDQASTLTTAHKALKPGGLFITKTPCLGARWYFRPMISVMRALGKAPPVVIQREAMLKRAILAAGFELVEELVQPGSAPRLYLVARRAG